MKISNLFLCMSCFIFRIYDLQFVDELIKIEAHESEILCVEFSQPDSGKNLFFQIFTVSINQLYMELFGVK